MRHNLLTVAYTTDVEYKSENFCCPDFVYDFNITSNMLQMLSHIRFISSQAFRNSPALMIYYIIYKQ